MAENEHIADFEISDFSPAWIDKKFPDDEEYIAIKEIILFYLFNCLCEGTSARGIDM